jgi:hypothetical protein
MSLYLLPGVYHCAGDHRRDLRLDAVDNVVEDEAAREVAYRPLGMRILQNENSTRVSLSRHIGLYGCGV